VRARLRATPHAVNPKTGERKQVGASVILTRQIHPVTGPGRHPTRSRPLRGNLVATGERFHFSSMSLLVQAQGFIALFLFFGS
jgi:hypothetical protein